MAGRPEKEQSVYVPSEFCTIIQYLNYHGTVSTCSLILLLARGYTHREGWKMAAAAAFVTTSRVQLCEGDGAMLNAT